MTVFQIIMLLASAFFAYKMYEYIQGIEENAEPESMRPAEITQTEPTVEELIEEADQAYMDGDLSAAQHLLENIVLSYPEYAEGHNKLAFVLIKQGDLVKAEKEYRVSLQMEERDDMTHNALATLLVSLNRNSEAEEHYKRALELDDAYAVTWFNYANLMVRLGKENEAKEMYQNALDLDPEFEQAREELEKLS